MIKKLMGLSLFLSLGLILVACQTPVVLNVNEEDITIVQGQEVTIAVTTDDKNGIEVTVSDDTVLKVKESSDEEIILTALQEGESSVTISSSSKSSLSKEIKVTVLKDITISFSDTEITMVAGDDLDLDVLSNDPNLKYESLNKTLFVVDDEGTITAKKEGSAQLRVSSEYNPDVTKEITVNVLRKVEIDVGRDSYVMVVGDTVDLDVSSSDDLLYESVNSDIVSITESGEMQALKFGTATVRATSQSQDNVFVEVSVTVYKLTEGLEIKGSNSLYVGMNTTLTIDATPLGAYPEVSYESSDESILTVDDQGMVLALSTGTASIIATSLIDDSIKDTFDIEVLSMIVVDQSKSSGDTYLYEGVDLEYGVTLFSDIETALEHSFIGTTILLAAGTYEEDFTIDLDGIMIEGMGEASIAATVTIAADDVELRMLDFSKDAVITNNGDIKNISIKDNTNSDMTSPTDGYFISLSGVEGLEIVDNVFTDLPDNAVLIDDFIDGLILVKNNVFDGMDTALVIQADRSYVNTTSINVVWNNFNDVDKAIEINLLDKNNEDKAIEAYVRFNSVVYNQTGASSYDGNDIDFTLNYWGSEILDYNDFDYITESMLRGYYEDSESIISEEDLDPRIPIIIEITNPISEIMIGESHTIEYSVLPMDMVDPYIRFITSNSKVLSVSNDGVLTPNISGESMITVRSGYTSKIKTTMDVNVVTTPGVELESDHIYNDLVIGDEFTVTATPFPLASSTEAITFTSNNHDVATIDQNGHVIVLGEGMVTLKASFTSDPSVYNEYTVLVYGDLDANNLLDYLTINQVNYSTPHEWIAYGYQGNYNDKRYESVSRYYFDPIEINTSKLVPVFYGIRPGEPMDTLSPLIRFNEDNIQWVVVHDTASSAPGSNALAHANYLYNNSVDQNPLWVSWHYTIDDTNVYQHLPENERGFHAGDGSTNPGDGSYLGGGNRNGIGIEMSINSDGDMYRTWQRTAKLVVDILTRHDLPISQQTYHNDFSGKDCPRTLRNAGLIPLFERFVEVEYYVKTVHPNAVIDFTSNNPEYLDDFGRVIEMPDRAMTVSYTITVVEDGQTSTRTFYTYLPGTVH